MTTNREQLELDIAEIQSNSNDVVNLQKHNSMLLLEIEEAYEKLYKEYEEYRRSHTILNIQVDWDSVLARSDYSKLLAAFSVTNIMWIIIVLILSYFMCFK